MDDLCEATLERMIRELMPSAEKIFFRPNEVSYLADGRVILTEDGKDRNGVTIQTLTERRDG